MDFHWRLITALAAMHAPVAHALIKLVYILEKKRFNKQILKQMGPQLMRREIHNDRFSMR